MFLGVDRDLIEPPLRGAGWGVTHGGPTEPAVDPVGEAVVDPGSGHSEKLLKSRERAVSGRSGAGCGSAGDDPFLPFIKRDVFEKWF